MPTIWDSGARKDILDRIAKLTPDQRPDWGKMNAGEMVRHCRLALDIFTGAAKVAPKSGPFRNPLLRYLIIHVLPWPQGAPTAPELVMTGYRGNWAEDVAALRQSLEVVVARGENGKFEDHPAFGALSGKSVGVLVWRHLDHHLRQFGMKRTG